MIMKKILMFMAIMISVVFSASCSSKPKIPEKTPAQLRADSIAKVKKDSAIRVANFKKNGIGYLERYLKVFWVDCIIINPVFKILLCLRHKRNFFWFWFFLWLTATTSNKHHGNHNCHKH